MKPLRVLPLPAFFLLFLLIAISSVALGQDHVVKGKVADRENKQALAFVNIAINEGHYGGMSDINGKFTVSCPEPIHTLRFSCLGYATEAVEVKPGTTRFDITLQPTAFELNEVTVEAGENPANRIIDSVMAHRSDNHPDALDAYRYHIYDQMVITIDSSNFGKLLDSVERTEGLAWLDNMVKNNDLMVMETFSEVLYQAPNRHRQNVLGTKMSGSKNNQLVYMVSSMQSTSFYDETVSIAGTTYVNPISKNSTQRYFFTLESVSPANDGDSLYVVSFHPLKGSTFNGLRGLMTIHSDGWALQTVKAAPEEEGGLYRVSIQQLYNKIEGRWFPYQLNTNLVFPGLMAEVDGHKFPMVAIGKSYVTDVELHPVFDSKAFSNIEVQVNETAAYRDDAFWTQHRIDSLTERVLNTYHLYDTLPGASDLIDRALGVTQSLVQSSALPLGPIDWNFGSTFRLSAMRGFYVGLDVSTNDRFSRHLRLSGFGGYWTRLKDFDYGAEARWLANRQRQMELGVRYAHKSTPLGEFNGFNEGASLLAEDQYKFTFYENILTRGNIAEVFYNTRLAQHFKAFVTLGRYDQHYHRPFYLQPSDSITSACLAKAEVKVRFAYNEKFISTASGLQSLGTDYPVVWLSYTRSFQGILGGQYAYDRWKFQVEKDFKTDGHGLFSVLLQAGFASEGCPVVETFNQLGSYEPFGLYSPGCFATMRENEFFSDRFVALFLSYNFQGSLWSPNSNWFKPQLSVVTNLGWGDMRHGTSSPQKNFSTMENGYFESGMVLNGLLSLPTMQLGVGVFYRYGPCALPKAMDNVAFKWCATFGI